MAGLGWVPENYDARDKPYRAPEGSRMLQRVDLSKSHGDWLHEIYAQVQSSSCVANATAAAYRWAARKQNADAKTAAVTDEPSRLFIYYNARVLKKLAKQGIKVQPGDTSQKPPPVGDNGSENRDSFKGMNLYGVASENSWPWVNLGEGDNAHPDHVNDTPSDAAYQDAKKSHVVEYCRLDPDHPWELEQDMTDEERRAVGIVTLMRLKQCLSEGFPVVLGFWFYADDNDAWSKPDKDGYLHLEDIPSKYWNKGPPRDPETGRAKFGGHTVLCIGYDNEKRGSDSHGNPLGSILCQNSWGPRWSKDGQFWVPYEYVADWEATDDFWMVRSVETPSKT
jgi:C1A family cysteine protease